MNQHTKLRRIFTATAAALAVLVTTAVAMADGPPTRTPDERTIRFHELPEEIGVMDREGNVVGTISREEFLDRAGRGTARERRVVVTDRGKRVGVLGRDGFVRD